MHKSMLRHKNICYGDKQMTTRHTLIFATSILIMALIIGLMSGQARGIGRYQMYIGKHAYVLDTTTGEVRENFVFI